MRGAFQSLTCASRLRTWAVVWLRACSITELFQPGYLLQLRPSFRSASARSSLFSVCSCSRPRSCSCSSWFCFLAS